VGVGCSHDVIYGTPCALPAIYLVLVLCALGAAPDIHGRCARLSVRTCCLLLTRSSLDLRDHGCGLQLGSLTSGAPGICSIGWARSARRELLRGHAAEFRSWKQPLDTCHAFGYVMSSSAVS
jgi:hypothetical protein